MNEHLFGFFYHKPSFWFFWLEEVNVLLHSRLYIFPMQMWCTFALFADQKIERDGVQDLLVLCTVRQHIKELNIFSIFDHQMPTPANMKSAILSKCAWNSSEFFCMNSSLNIELMRLPKSFAWWLMTESCFLMVSGFELIFCWMVNLSTAVSTTHSLSVCCL